MDAYPAGDILYSKLYSVQIGPLLNSDVRKMQEPGSQLAWLLPKKKMNLLNEKQSMRLSVLIEIAAVGTGNFISRDLVQLTEL